MKKKRYIASWSGGKDSTANIILAHEHGEPLDLIIFSEVMFDEKISGELPEQMRFIHDNAIPVFESWGYKVEILHAEKTFLDCFFHIPTKGKHVGTGCYKGFMMTGHCDTQRDCKLKPIKKFMKQFDKNEIRQYIGIAIDEPRRLARLDETQISLLQKYEYTEQDAKELCEKYGLLSPIYQFTKRGGCWFCPNARKTELRHLRDNHPELWKKLLDLEDIPNLVGNIWNTLEKKSIHDMEKLFQQEDAQITIFDYFNEKGD